MDFNYTNERNAVKELNDTLDGIRMCDDQLKHGFDIDYHQDLKEQYMRQYAKQVDAIGKRMGGNAIAVDMPENVGVLILDEVNEALALLELDEIERAIGANN